MNDKKGDTSINISDTGGNVEAAGGDIEKRAGGQMGSNTTDQGKPDRTKLVIGLVAILAGLFIAVYVIAPSSLEGDKAADIARDVLDTSVKEPSSD